MADTINLSDTSGGQSIPAALAATPASRKPRAKGGKFAKAEPKVEHPLATLAEAEATIEAIAPVESTPVEPRFAKPEPVASAPEPMTSAPSEAHESVAEAQPVIIPEAVAPAPVSTPTAAVTAEPRKESIMATTIDNVTNQTAENTAKAQAFFADANGRTKDVVAKGQKFFEEAASFSKGNVEAMVESSKIAAKAFETMGQDAAEYGRKAFEEATAAFKTLATVKSPTEFMKLQSDYVRSSFDSLVAETSRSTEQVLKLAGEVAQPISNRLSLAAEKIKTAA